MQFYLVLKCIINQRDVMQNSAIKYIYSIRRGGEDNAPLNINSKSLHQGLSQHTTVACGGLVVTWGRAWAGLGNRSMGIGELWV